MQRRIFNSVFGNNVVLKGLSSGCASSWSCAGWYVFKWHLSAQNLTETRSIRLFIIVKPDGPVIVIKDRVQEVPVLGCHTPNVTLAFRLAVKVCFCYKYHSHFFIGYHYALLPCERSKQGSMLRFAVWVQASSFLLSRVLYLMDSLCPVNSFIEPYRYKRLRFTPKWLNWAWNLRGKNWRIRRLPVDLLQDLQPICHLWSKWQS